MLTVAAAAGGPRLLAADATPQSTTRPADPADYVRQLARSLQDGSLPSRMEAAQRLAEINRPDARDALTAALSSPDERTQAAAAHAAAQAVTPDPLWFPPLSTMLDRQPNAEYAGYAAQALARFEDDPRASDALIRAAQSHRAAQLPAIRAMGRVVQKRVAAVLLLLTNDPNEPAAVHEAALDGLARISPQTRRTEGNVAWTRWWNERNNLADPAWRAQVVAEQHRFLDAAEAREAEQAADARRALYRLLYNQYEQQPVNRKSDFIASLLNSPEAEVRAAGARIVPEAVVSGVLFKTDVKERLEALVNDASAEVRLNVADALYSLSYSDAFGAVVARLSVESDLRVKKALVKALARMDAQAIPVLEGLLKDPSESVAAAAGDALTELVRSRSLDAQTRQSIFDIVRQTLIDRTGPPGEPRPDASVDLRASLVAAMGATADWHNQMEMIPLVRAFLGAEPSTVRQAAVHALASGGMEAGPTLSNILNPSAENDPQVRREAAVSLGSIPSFRWAGRLEQSSRAPDEPDPAVREAAWQSLQRVLPYGDPSDLLQMAQSFKNRHEPDRRLVVERAACRKIKDPISLAAELQTVGDISALELKRPADAIQPYRDALKIYQDRRNTQLPLIKSLLSAYLAANRITDAIEFCREQITFDPRTKQDPLGSTLAETAETWAGSKNPANWEKARELLTQSLTLDLDESSRGRLQSALNKLPSPPATRPTTEPAQASR